MRYGLTETNDGHFGDRSAFPAQSSVLDEEALLRRVIVEYEIPAAKACAFFERGDGDIYRVHTVGPTFYLKVYRPPNTSRQAETEARLLSDLARRGVLVVGAVRRKDGAFASEVIASEGPRPALLFEAAPDAKVGKLDEQAGERLGMATAGLHIAADLTDSDYDLPTFDVNWVVRERLQYAQRLISDADNAEVNAVLEGLQERLQRFATTPPDFGLCHRDLVCSNIRKQAGGSFVFFDFANAAYTWRGYELAVLHQSLRSHTAAETYEQVRDALLTGYSRDRELPDGFDQQLPVFDLLRKVSWICGNMADCPLRMGTEPFSQEWVREQMLGVRELAECLRA